MRYTLIINSVYFRFKLGSKNRVFSVILILSFSYKAISLAFVRLHFSKKKNFLL